MIENDDENLMRRYLLGELDENESIEIEDRVFADADARAMLSAAENDLIDEYAANHLTDDERKRFEAMFFNSPERLEKIEFAETLTQISPAARQISTEISGEKRKVFWARLFDFSFAPQFALAAMAFVFIVFGVWFLFLRHATTTEIARENANQNVSETPAPTVNLPSPESSPSPAPKTNSDVGNISETNKNTNKNANVAAPTPRTPSALTFATLIFPANLTRDNGAPKLGLTIPANAQNARFIFNLEKGDEFPFYQIAVASQTGANVAQARLTRHNRTIVLDVPAAKLLNGFYTATLKGINSAGETEIIGYYDFTVRRP